MAKAKLNIEDMFGTFEPKKVQRAKEEQIVNKEQSLSAPIVTDPNEENGATIVAPALVTIRTQEKQVERKEKNFRLEVQPKRMVKNLDAEIKIRLKSDIKEEFQLICNNFGYTMTEIIKEFINGCVKKNKL